MDKCEKPLKDSIRFTHQSEIIFDYTCMHACSEISFKPASRQMKKLVNSNPLSLAICANRYAIIIICNFETKIIITTTKMYFYRIIEIKIMIQIIIIIIINITYKITNLI